jgi:two-component system heavy metal sensor histidine kinase CusS
MYWNLRRKTLHHEQALTNCPDQPAFRCGRCTSLVDNRLCPDSCVVEAHFKEEDRYEFNGKLELIQNLFKHTNTQKELDLLPQQLDDALVGHHGLALAVTDATGDIRFPTSGADVPRALLQDCQIQPVTCASGALRQWKQAEMSYRGMAASMTAGTGKPYTVAVTLDIEHHEVFMNKFRSVLALAIALAALATASLGLAVTRWRLSPLLQVTDMVAGVSAQHLQSATRTHGVHSGTGYRSAAAVQCSGTRRSRRDNHCRFSRSRHHG